MVAVGGKQDQIVVQFAAWGKTLACQIEPVQDAPALEKREVQVRQPGQAAEWRISVPNDIAKVPMPCNSNQIVVGPFGPDRWLP